VGERSFSFCAQDKDGWSEPVAVAVQVLPAQVAAILMADDAGVYQQSFDGLAASGASIPWDNAVVPLAGWYAYANALPVTAYRAGNGADTAGGLYSFGASGSADRSLGSLASNGNTYRYGVAFTNGTALAVTNLSIRFQAAQWRVGASVATNTLLFEYCITNRVLPLNQGVWRRVNALCFDSSLVTNATQGAGAVAVPEQTALSANVTRPVPPGGVVLLRWSDADDAGNDHAFGIDDVTVEWAAGSLPEGVPVGRAGAAENFDEMGDDADGGLPWRWRIETRDDAPRASGAYAAAAHRVTHAGGVAAFPAPGLYRFASDGVRDQAVGGLPDAAQVKSVSLFAKCVNAAGAPVRNWAVRFTVEKHRNGTSGCAVRLLRSSDGEAWTEAGAPVAFPPDADTGPVPPGEGAAVAERCASFGAPVPPGGVFYLAWQIAVAEGDASDGAQALAIDDVRVDPVFARASLLMLR
jgi:hypothetical protein